jgi:effector-binding domain-containing protein
MMARLAALVLLAASCGSVAAAEFLPPGTTLESVVEAPAIVTLPAEPVICVAVETGRAAPDRSDKIIAAHNRAYHFSKDNGLALRRGALEISSAYEEPGGTWRTEACRAIEALPDKTYPDASDLKFYAVPAGKAVQALHRGSHDTIRDTIDQIEAFIREKGLERKGPLVEYHFNHKPPEEEHLQISVVTLYVK